MVINHHISNVMVPIGLRAAFHGLIGLESSFEAFPENHGLLVRTQPNFKGWMVRPSVRVVNCLGNICIVNICPCKICPSLNIMEYLS